MVQLSKLNILKTYRPETYWVLLVALLVDFILLGIYVFYGAADIVFDLGKMPHLWNIAEEGSASEVFNYVKWAIICSSLMIVYTRCRIPLFASFAFTFFLILLDDSLQLHERGGAWFVETFQVSSAFGLRAQDFGELTVWASLGVFVSAALLYGFLKRTAESFVFGIYFLGVFSALVFVAIGLDMVNALDVLNIETGLVNAIVGIITIMEDGGEMIVASFGLAGAVAAMKASSKALGDLKKE